MYFPGSEDLINFEVYVKAIGHIRWFVLGNSGTQADAEDITQEAVLTYIHRMEQGNLTEDAKPSTIIAGIGKNLWLKELDKRKKIETLVSEESSKSDRVEDREIENKKRQEVLLDLYDRGVKQMDEPCKSILTMKREYRDFPFIAAKMGYKKIETAYMHFHRCKKRLLEIINEQQEFKELIGYE